MGHALKKRHLMIRNDCYCSDIFVIKLQILGYLR